MNWVAALPGAPRRVEQSKIRRRVKYVAVAREVRGLLELNLAALSQPAATPETRRRRHLTAFGP